MKKIYLLISLLSTTCFAQADWHCTDKDGRTFTLTSPTLIDTCIDSKTGKKYNNKTPQKRGVYIGMSTEEVLQSSWGKPEHVNRTTNAYGISEQWVYKGRNYLYFKNGVLSTIQN